MSLIDALLGVSVLSTGLFTGLLMTILAFFQRALKDHLSGLQFALVMQRFLRIVRAHPLNYALVFTSAFVPIAALALLRDSPGGAAFVLSALGLLAFSLVRPDPDVVFLRRADLRRFHELGDRCATGGLTKGSREVLPHQRDPRAGFGHSLQLLRSGTRFADILTDTTDPKGVTGSSIHGTLAQSGLS